MKYENKTAFKIIIGVIIFLVVFFFVSFTVGRCSLENEYHETSLDYRATIDRLEKQLDDENDTIQQITIELQATREENTRIRKEVDQFAEDFDRFNREIRKSYLESTERIEELKETNSDDEKRLKIITGSIKEIKQAVSK